MARNISRLLILSLTLASWLNAQERPVAFVDVTVVPMDKEQILPHQTVVVQGGRVTQVGSAASVKVPRDALKIDGRRLSGPIRASYFRIVYARHLGGISAVVSDRLPRSRLHGSQAFSDPRS
jgi:putative transposon-encoded protein